MLSFCCVVFFFFKQKTAYEMRISDWSSDVCSSDLSIGGGALFLNDVVGHRRNRVQMPGQLRIVDPDPIPVLDEDQELHVRERVQKIGRASCRERVCQYV